MKKNKHSLKKEKNLKNFLFEEEGKITEKSAVKLGIYLLTVATMTKNVIKPDDVSAGSAHSSHCSHGSHGSHGDGGGCSWGTW